MKCLTVTLILTGFSCLAHAQSFYLKFGGGYSFPSASTLIGSSSNGIYLKETDPENGFYLPAYIRSGDAVTGSYNSGVTASATFGYQTSSNMGFEVNLGYVFGKKYKAYTEHTDMIDEAVINTSKSVITTYSRNAYVAPAFVLTAGERNLRPYLSAGVVLAMAQVEVRSNSRSDYDGDNGTSGRTEKYSGGLSFGLRGGAGLELKLNEKLGLFSELSLISMSYYPRERETTRYEEDGENLLATMNEYTRKTKYTKSTQSDTRSDADPASQPSKALRFSFAMSSITAQAGLRMSL